MSVDSLHIALKAVDFWALFACVGLVLARIGLLPAAAFDDPAVKLGWQRRLGFALGLLTVTGVALLLIRTMEMGDSTPLEAFRTLPAVLQQTHYGHVWALHLLSLTVLWLGWLAFSRSRGRGSASLMLVALAVTVFTYSASSHAADRGDFTLGELCDWLHVLGGALWGGGILATALFSMPMLRRRGVWHRAWIGETVDRLSTLSAVSFVLVLATGLYNAASRLDRLSDLASDSYGYTLSIKLILVAALAGIGAINRFVLVPKVKHWATDPTVTADRPPRRIMVALWIDTILVLLILSAAAVLVQRMPFAAMRNIPGMG
jgi:putative copper resistance protein D